jgi:hypothetical protein
MKDVDDLIDLMVKAVLAMRPDQTFGVFED